MLKYLRERRERKANEEAERKRQDAYQDAREEAGKRHETRDAEYYLEGVLKSSQYIENLAILMKTISNELKTGTYNYSDESYNRLADSARFLSKALRNELKIAESLYTGRDNQLAPQKVMNEHERQYVVSKIREVLSYAAQMPTRENGLSKETQVAARAALDVLDTKLGVVFANDKIKGSLDKHNDSFAARMAAEDRNHRKTGGVEAYKQNQEEKLETLKQDSAEREARRTQGFTKAEEARAENKDSAIETAPAL